MWFWLLVAVAGVIVGGLVVARNRVHRRPLAAMLGILVAIVVGIEFSVRGDWISRGQATGLISIVTMVAVMTGGIIASRQRRT